MCLGRGCCFEIVPDRLILPPSSNPAWHFVLSPGSNIIAWWGEEIQVQDLSAAQLGHHALGNGWD